MEPPRRGLMERAGTENRTVLSGMALFSALYNSTRRSEGTMGKDTRAEAVILYVNAWASRDVRKMLRTRLAHRTKGLGYPEWDREDHGRYAIPRSRDHLAPWNVVQLACLGWWRVLP